MWSWRQGRGLFFLGPLPLMQASPYPGLSLQIAFIPFFSLQRKGKNVQVNGHLACIFCLMALGLTEAQTSCTKFAARDQCAQIVSPVVSQAFTYCCFSLSRTEQHVLTSFKGINIASPENAYFDK